jgi:plastocyanin domain-containing protein
MRPAFLPCLAAALIATLACQEATAAADSPPAKAAVKPAAKAETAAKADAAKSKTVEVKVTENGFEPKDLKLKQGEAVTLVFTRTTDSTCIKAIEIPDENVHNLQLPLNKAVSVTITPKKKGATEAFYCSAMSMGDGKLVIE